jgi:LysR family glycine cleavage system transcriptional activator
MSFAKAAEELAVTPAALSYQIKQLEEHLGLSLFHRLNRAVELTEAGRLLAPGVADGFDAFRQAVRGLDRLRDGNALTITAGPAFTAKWLAPRLYRFVAEHGEIEVSLIAALRIMDFARDGVDAAVRFGYTPEADLYSEILIEEKMAPVCSPDLARTLKAPEDLLTASLLHDDSLARMSDAPTWNDWLHTAGVHRDDWRRGPRFSNADHVLDAAAAGAGVALGRLSLAEEDLRSGRLAAPFDMAVDVGAHFRFVCPKGAETRPSLAAFLDWLRSETANAAPSLPDLRVVPVKR